MKKALFYITVLGLFILVYILTSDKKINNGFSTVLYPAPAESSKKVVPSKLEWFDSFKGISNSK